VTQIGAVILIQEEALLALYSFIIGNNLISWNSTLQKTVALSSCEAEYTALKEATKEDIYLNNTIKYLTFKLQLYNNNTPIILVNNQGSLLVR
jgi:hypothetical protein